MSAVTSEAAGAARDRAVARLRAVTCDVIPPDGVKVMMGTNGRTTPIILSTYRMTPRAVTFHPRGDGTMTMTANEGPHPHHERTVQDDAVTMAVAMADAINWVRS